MTRLDALTGGHEIYPVVMEGLKNAPFGRPRQRLLTVWRELQEDELYLDLLYGPRAWEVLFERWGKLPPVLEGAQILYYHCGGLEGVSSQLNRYKHAGLVTAREVM
eukprot:FR739464.1.p2 GENE.FR739464.1~~FR739464.1.p2  ORF type:complete len:116 (+),score=5.35 FR739464.1:33-350(+)